MTPPARRRRRAGSRQGPPRPRPEPTTVEPTTVEPTTVAPRAAARTRDQTPSRRGAPRRPRPARDSGDGGLRDLVGSGSSQLGVSGALRGRDVNRPTEADLAAAERETVIVRRNWQPPA